MVVWIILAVLLFGALLYWNRRSKLDESLYNKKYQIIVPELSSIEYDLLIALNEYRVSQGLKMLMTDKLCRDLGEYHILYMIEIDVLSHELMSNRAIKLMEQGAKAVAETVGWGNNSGEGFVNNYINSPRHQRALTGNFTHVGIRCIKDKNNRYYNTLIFIRV